MIKEREAVIVGSLVSASGASGHTSAGTPGLALVSEQRRAKSGQYFGVLETVSHAACAVEFGKIFEEVFSPCVFYL